METKRLNENDHMQIRKLNYIYAQAEFKIHRVSLFLLGAEVIESVSNYTSGIDYEWK